RPCWPVIVSAATKALRIASSVASAAASKSGVMASAPSITTSTRPASIGTLLPVEKARKMSPLLLAPKPPAQASPVVARRARRWPGVVLGHREGGGIAEPGVGGFRHHRQVEGLAGAGADGVGADGVADDAHGMGVGDGDRRAQQALLGDPDEAGHLAIAVEG